MISQFSHYCFQTKILRQIVHGHYLYFSHSDSPLPSLVKICSSSTRHHKKLSFMHLFSVISADSIFAELWNFSHCLILYPGAESMRLGQEAKSVNSLGSCPKFCLSEGWEGGSCQVSICPRLHGTPSKNGTVTSQTFEGG